MARITLKDLDEVTIPFERMPVPFDPELRRNVMLSLVSITTSLVFLWALPDLIFFSRSSGFLLALGGLFTGVLSLILALRPVIVFINVAALLLCLLLISTTNNLEKGDEDMHRLAMAENYIGAVNGGIMALEAGILIGNVVLWIFIGVLAIALTFMILAALAAGV